MDLKNHADWNESYYFNFYDEKKDITLFTRIGNKPNKNEKTMFLFIINKNDIKGMRASTEITENYLECSNLNFNKKNNVWHISYSGPIVNPLNKTEMDKLVLDIEWTPLNEEMDYRDCVDEKGTSLSSNVASEHYEQFGRAVGSMTINDTKIDIFGYGERDKSLGVRDWGSPKMWLWLNSVYDEKYAFNMSKLVTESGNVDAGYFHDDKNNPIVSSEIDIKKDEKGFPIGYEMIMYDKNKKSYSVTAKIIHTATLPMEGSKDMLLVETISETMWDGKKGYGIAEFLIPHKK